MRYFILVFVTSLVSTVAAGQTYFTVKAGSRLRDVISIEDIYEFPSFSKGVVQFKNGRPGVSKMNYNRYSGEMEFLEGKDTLNLMEKETVKHVTISDSVFYVHPEYGYLQPVAEMKSTILAKKEFIKLVDRQKGGAYGTMNSTSAIDSYTSLVNANGNSVYGGRMLELVANEDMIYRTGILYYFGDEKGNFVHADKKAVLKLYPKKKSFLSEYLKSHEVDFDKEADLKALLTVISDED
jgi:hypothetical protein